MAGLGLFLWWGLTVKEQGLPSVRSQIQTVPNRELGRRSGIYVNIKINTLFEAMEGKENLQLIPRPDILWRANVGLGLHYTKT